MEVEIRNENEAAVIVLRGEVDLDTSPRLRKSLLDCVGVKRRVVVDLAEVSYIDSSGIASLVEAYQIARGGPARFALAAVSEPVRRVLELARLDQVFTLYPTVAEALRGSP